MKKALKTLDDKLSAQGFHQVKLLIGGGGALALAHHIPLHTSDIDAIPFKSAIEAFQLDPLIKETGRELGISPDWLNPYFSTFFISLPHDYGDRLITVYQGNSLRALALSATDLLIMKCFAAREKDLLHAKLLIKKGADVDFTEEHIENLRERGIPGAQEALDFLLEAEELAGG